MSTKDGEVYAHMWWCGDQNCDCTQPKIERMDGNKRHVVEAGPFLSRGCGYEKKEIDEQFAWLKEACIRHNIPYTWDEDGNAIPTPTEKRERI